MTLVWIVISLPMAFDDSEVARARRAGERRARW